MAALKTVLMRIPAMSRFKIEWWRVIPKVVPEKNNTTANKYPFQTYTSLFSTSLIIALKERNSFRHFHTFWYIAAVKTVLMRSRILSHFRIV